MRYIVSLGCLGLLLTAGCRVAEVNAPEQFVDHHFGPRYTVDPPSPGLSGRITSLGNRLSFDSQGDAACEQYGDLMAYSLGAGRIRTEQYLFNRPDGGIASGTSSPSDGSIGISRNWDRAENGPPLNPRTDDEMAMTAFHEVVHLATGNYSESFVKAEMSRCLSLSDGPQFPIADGGL